MARLATSPLSLTVDEVGNWLDWLGRQLDESDVDLRFGRRLTTRDIDRVVDTESPDVIVVATGRGPPVTVGRR